MQLRSFYLFLHLTFTVIFFTKPLAVKDTFALPFLMLVNVKVALPSALVVSSSVETDIFFLPALSNFARTVTPSAAQSFFPVTVTVTTLLSLLLIVGLCGDAMIDTGVHPPACVELTAYLRSPLVLSK